jgi:DNA-binding CsgD family transcriptional regulator
MRILADDDLLAPGERESSEFYRGFAAAADASHSLFWSFDVGERFFAFTALRSAAQGPAGHAERRLMSEIRAKATQAAIVSAHLEEAREQGLIASLESAGMAALALDRDGAVVGATQAGEALLAADFTQVNGALSLKESAGRAAFGALERLKADLRSSAPTSQQGAFAIDRPDKAPILCTPLHHKTPTHEALSEVRTLLILKDLAAPAALSGDVLMRLYGLTPAEADVARQIAAGLSVEEISRARAVAEVTTRTILRAVFRKTGASRQGELAAMLNRLA